MPALPPLSLSVREVAPSLVLLCSGFVLTTKKCCASLAPPFFSLITPQYETGCSERKKEKGQR